MDSPKDTQGRKPRSQESLLLGGAGQTKEHPGFHRPRSWTGARRILNKRLLLVTILLVAILVPATVFWHQWQVHSSASAMLLHVDKLAAEGKTVEATLQLQRYAELVGTEDLDTLLRMVDLLQRAEPETLNMMRHEARYQRRILDIKPTLTQNRRRLAEVLFAIGSYSLAADEARVLLREDKNDTTAMRILANSLYARQEFPQALAAYRQAVKVNPHDIISYARMANCYMRTGDDKLAGGVIDEMVARNPNSGEALFRRYMFRRTTDKKNASPDDLENALNLEKSNPEILLEAAGYALDNNKFDLAKERYKKLVDLSQPGTPQWVVGYIGLGNAFLKANDPQGAVQTWNAALATEGAGDKYQLTYRLVDGLLLAKTVDDVPRLLKQLRDYLDRLSMQKGRRPDEMVSADRSVDLLEAKYNIVRGEPRKAIPLLRAASRTEFGNPAITQEALQLLGELYIQFEEWDAAAEVLQRASAANPDALATRFLLGRSLAEAGRTDEALGIFNVLAQGASAPPLVWLSLAQLNYRKQLSLPPAARNWQSFERSLEGCAKNGVGMIDIVLLQASYQATNQEVRKAMVRLAGAEMVLLNRAVKQTLLTPVLRGIAAAAPLLGRPKDAYANWANRPWPFETVNVATSRLWIGMMELVNAADLPKISELMARAGVSMWPSSVSMILAAASLEAELGNVDQALATIDKGVARLDVALRPALLRTKSRLLQQIDDINRLIEVRTQLAESEPNNIDNLVSLAEDLTAARRFEEAANYVDRVKAMEGDEGINWRYALAILKLAQRETETGTELEEAAKLSQEILARRASWSRGQLLGAMVAVQQNKPDRAIEFYKRTIQYGDRRPDVYRQLLRQLLMRGDLLEAEQYMADLKGVMVEDARFVPMSLYLNARRRDFGQAEATARKFVEQHPDDPNARVWLADALVLQAKYDEAIASYRKAIELAPQNLEAYMNLVRLYNQLEKYADARSVIEELSQTPSLGDRKDLVLGYFWGLVTEPENTADLDRAKEHYLAVTRNLKDDPRAIRMAIEFFVRNKMSAEAEAAIKQLELVDAKDPYLRRARALWKFTLPDAQSWQEALNLMADQDSSDDLRVRALLLERMRGPDQIREAIRLLETVANRAEDVTPNDRYSLAKLYQIEGKYENAISHLSSIVFDEGADPDYVRACLNLMLQAGRWQGEPEVLLKRLETQEPSKFSTKELRARWLDRAKRRPEAIAFVKDTMETEKGNPHYTEILLGCARLLGSMDQLEDAEKAYRQLEKMDPNGYQHLAVFLTTQGRGDEAVKLCLAKYDELGPNAGLGALRRAANISGLTAVSPELEAKIDDLLVKACKDPAEELKMSRVIAERQLRRGRYEDAIKFYKRSLVANPNNWTDLNNYAVALSKLGQGSDALQQIDQAIAIAGPQIELLDTKGMILLEGKDVNAALSIFNKVTTDARASAINFLHLAYACKQANRLLEMRTALDRAKARGLNIHSMAEDDRRIYAELSGLEGTTT